MCQSIAPHRFPIMCIYYWVFNTCMCRVQSVCVCLCVGERSRSMLLIFSVAKCSVLCLRCEICQHVCVSVWTGTTLPTLYQYHSSSLHVLQLHSRLCQLVWELYVGAQIDGASWWRHAAWAFLKICIIFLMLKLLLIFIVLLCMWMITKYHRGINSFWKKKKKRQDQQSGLLDCANMPEYITWFRLK